MEETTSSPPLSGQRNSTSFYFLPKAMSSDPTPRAPAPRPKKMKMMMMKKKTPGTTVILSRRASMRINNNGRSFRFKEPRSPKVSCFGKVANNSRNKNQREDDSEGKDQSDTAAFSPPNSSLILKLFWVFKKKGTKLANRYAESSSPPSAVSKRPAPKLVQPKKCSGSRGGLSCFDWRVHDSSAMAPDPPSSLPNKREKRKDVVVVENIELVPRKEINLWKKRMVSPPPPLLV